MGKHAPSGVVIIQSHETWLKTGYITGAFTDLVSGQKRL
jgi:hypothetical protein